MRIVIAGGSGKLGSLLAQALEHDGQEIVILSRRPDPDRWNVACWDGRTLGPWAKAIDGADVVINLAGQNVLCRYNDTNRRMIRESRLDAIRVLGQSITAAANPPQLWIQMSTANIYAHRFDEPNDEESGVIGGREAEIPDSWRFSVTAARAAEEAFDGIAAPHTRKVLLRTAPVMAATVGGAFDIFSRLVRFGFGSRIGTGRQYVSWIHSYDFERSVRRIIKEPTLSGAINICSPHPLPNSDFLYFLRQAWGVAIAAPIPIRLLRTFEKLLPVDAEHVLKSRRVTPERLVQSGFEFVFATWPRASEDLVTEWKRRFGKDKETT